MRVEYGDKVKYLLTGEIGTVIGFMHRDHDRKLLVKFDMDHEIWINEIDLEAVDD